MRFLIFTILFTIGAAVNAQEEIKLGTANTVVFRNEVTEQSVQDATLKLMQLDQARAGRSYPIYLVLDTPGGSIDAGETFIEAVKSIKNLKTITIFAASMGSAIVEALPGERLITESGILMFHRAKGQVSGQFETGEMETRLEFYKKYIRRMEQRNADRMSMSLDDYKKNIFNEMWLTSAESMEKKAADKVVTVKCSQALIDRAERSILTIFIFQVEVEYSACPLLRMGKVAGDQPKEAVEAYNKYRGLQKIGDDEGVRK